MFQVLKKYTIKLTESRASVVFQFKSASAYPTYCQDETREGTALRNSKKAMLHITLRQQKRTSLLYITQKHCMVYVALRQKKALLCITVRKQEALFSIQCSKL